MTKYREILRLTALGLSLRDIEKSLKVSRKTVVKVQKRADELSLSWPLDESLTDAELEQRMFPKDLSPKSTKRMPDFDYIRKELLKNGVNKKLLWTEYLEECSQNGDDALMYSQFCYYIQQNEQKSRATMHIPRKAGQQIEVDWAGDPAKIIDPDTGEITEAWIFVGVMTYSQYAFVEAFINEQQKSWITAHVHMYEFFGGVTPILVSDNAPTATNRKQSDKYESVLIKSYEELAQHYNTAIIPARVRAPKDKPSVEGNVGHVSTWITAALRNEQFFSLEELNQEIRKKLKKYNAASFQKKEGSRQKLFLEDEKPLLMPLPATRFELAEHRTATAVAIAIHLGVPMDMIREACREFKAVEHRIEYVRERFGVTYYNDSKGTNPDAAIQAIKAMPGPTLLIAGGYDKHSEYDEWIENFDGKVRYLVLIGQTRDKIAECAKKHGITDIMYAEDMQEAVQVCASYANAGDYVLLSPACASWGMFKNFEERGRIFKECVNAL